MENVTMPKFYSSEMENQSLLPVTHNPVKILILCLVNGRKKLFQRFAICYKPVESFKSFVFEKQIKWKSQFIALKKNTVYWIWIENKVDFDYYEFVNR